MWNLKKSHSWKQRVELWFPEASGLGKWVDKVKGYEVSVMWCE